MPRENFRQNQRRHQNGVQRRLNDKNNVPGIPFLPKRPERPHSVVIGVIQQNMAQARDVGKHEKHSPAWRQVWNVCASSPYSPDEIHEACDQRRDEDQTQKRVGESAMVREADHRTFEAPEDVQIWSFRSQGHRRRSQRSFSIEARPRQNGAGQEMSDRFQGKFVTHAEAIRRISGLGYLTKSVHGMIFRH